MPVVNALTDEFHPCQILADLQTVREHKRHAGRAHLRPTWATRANNMAHSYLLGGATAGMHVRIGGPAGLPARPGDRRRRRARSPPATGGSVAVTTDAAEACAGADVLATDTWVSMGQEDEKAERASRPFRPYAARRGRAGARPPPDAIVLHCLPAYRGKEIAAE